MLSSYVINEQNLYDEIFSKFEEISKSNEEDDEEDEYDDNHKKREKKTAKKKALFFWKAGELRKLMELLKNKKNRSIVSHAITFILSLEREEELGGINTSHLNNSARKEFRKVLQSELSENLPN